MTFSTKTAAWGAAALAVGGAWINAARTSDEFGCSEMSDSKGRLGCQMNLLADEERCKAFGHPRTLSDQQLLVLRDEVRFETIRTLDEISKLPNNTYYSEHYAKGRWYAEGVKKLKLTDNDPLLSEWVGKFSAK